MVGARRSPPVGSRARRPAQLPDRHEPKRPSGHERGVYQRPESVSTNGPPTPISAAITNGPPSGRELRDLLRKQVRADKIQSFVCAEAKSVPAGQAGNLRLSRRSDVDRPLLRNQAHDLLSDPPVCDSPSSHAGRSTEWIGHLRDALVSSMSGGGVRVIYQLGWCYPWPAAGSASDTSGAGVVHGGRRDLRQIPVGLVGGCGPGHVTRSRPQRRWIPPLVLVSDEIAALLD